MGFQRDNDKVFRASDNVHKLLSKSQRILGQAVQNWAIHQQWQAMG